MKRPRPERLKAFGLGSVLHAGPGEEREAPEYAIASSVSSGHEPFFGSQPGFRAGEQHVERRLDRGPHSPQGFRADRRRQVF